jgi:hypothetical protein
MYGLPSPDHDGLDGDDHHYGGETAAVGDMMEEELRAIAQNGQMVALVEEIEERLRQQRRDKLFQQMEEVKQLMRAELARESSSSGDAELKITPEEIEHLDFGEDVDHWVKLAVKLQNALEGAEERLAHTDSQLHLTHAQLEDLSRTVELQEHRIEALREEKEQLRQQRAAARVDVLPGGSPPSQRGTLPTTTTLPRTDPRLREKEQEIARLCNENRRQRIEMVHLHSSSLP